MLFHHSSVCTCKGCFFFLTYNFIILSQKGITAEERMRMESVGRENAIVCLLEILAS